MRLDRSKHAPNFCDLSFSRAIVLISAGDAADPAVMVTTSVVMISSSVVIPSVTKS